MRHRMQKNYSFGRHRGPRKALLRGLFNSLVEKERIKTTLPKARALRPLVERAITMGKKNTLNARRLLLARYPFKRAVQKITDELPPRFKDRNGGYTRIIKLGARVGDKAPLAYLEFVDYTPRLSAAEKPSAAKAPPEEKKKAKADQKSSKKQKADQKTKPATEKKAKAAPATAKAKKLLSAKAHKKRKAARKLQKKARRVNRK